MLDDLPVLGVCGWSGSGKTTVVESLLPRLRERGLKVAVVKHDVHGLDVDHPGKDSDRFFRAGADVLLDGPGEALLRSHTDGDLDLACTLRSLAHRYDLVLVEGHKTAPLCKVWLQGKDEPPAPPDVPGVIASVPRAGDPADAVLRILNEWLPLQWLKTATYGCVLAARGADGSEGIERTAELLGRVTETVVLTGGAATFAGPPALTRLPTVGGCGGPLAGLLSAMRWAPGVSWLVAETGAPDLSVEALRRLLSTRAPGVWATVSDAKDEPFPAHFDFRARPLLERLAASGRLTACEIANSPKVISVPLPRP